MGNPYTGGFYTVAQLLVKRAALVDALEGGSVTKSAIAPGVAHEFQGKSDAELQRLLGYMDEALYALDPSKYPNPAAPGITRANFNGCR